MRSIGVYWIASQNIALVWVIKIDILHVFIGYTI